MRRNTHTNQAYQALILDAVLLNMYNKLIYYFPKYVKTDYVLITLNISIEFVLIHLHLATQPQHLPNQPNRRQQTRLIRILNFKCQIRSQSQAYLKNIMS